MRFIALSAACIALPALAQTAYDPAQITDRIAQAQTNASDARQAQDTATTARSALEQKQADALAPKPTGTDDAAASASSQQRLSQALRNLSEEGKNRLGSGSDAAPKAQPLNASPQPQAMPKAAQPKTESQPITIIAESTIFDSPKGIFVAVGNVDVQHPQFHLTCEELEVHLTKPKAKDKAKPGDPPPPADSGAMTTGNLEQIIARGPKVLIEQIAENGELCVGQCRLFNYDPKTKIAILKIWPQVQKGSNRQIALSVGTVITINEKGSISTSGGQVRTEVVQPSDQPTKPTAPPAGASRSEPAPEAPTPTR
jgi:lipopolysaccharide export system protein LptA